MSHANTGHASAGVDWCGYRTTQSILNEITLTRGDHHARTDDHQHA